MNLVLNAMSLPVWGEWIEISDAAKKTYQDLSLPMRGEWIEISFRRPLRLDSQVSPHAGRVD